MHGLVPKDVWSKRYDRINEFEKNLVESGTSILKFYLHINEDEQLARFEQRLDDPMRNWKISESDYAERKLWPAYVEAFEEVFHKTSTAARALVRHPGEPQVVPQSRGLEHRRRRDGLAGAQAPEADGEHRRDPAKVPAAVKAERKQDRSTAR